MDLNTITDISKKSQLLFQGEIACQLVENKKLIARICFHPSSEGASPDCTGEMRLEETGTSVEMKRSISVTDSDELMEFLADLRALLCKKLRDALESAVDAYTKLELVTVNGHSRPASPVPQTPDLRNNFIRKNPADGQIRHSYLGTTGTPGPGSNGHSAGAYLPSRGQSPSHTRQPAPKPATVPSAPPPSDKTDIRTNYTAVEHIACRILHLQEAIRGMSENISWT